jgi:hypothetical protein
VSARHMVEEEDQHSITLHQRNAVKPNEKCSSKTKNFVFTIPSSMFQSVPKFVYFHRKEFRRKNVTMFSLAANYCARFSMLL